MKKIKFHSIYYRFILFIFAIFLTSINSIDRVNKVTFDFKGLKVEYLNICFFVISIVLIWYFEFFTWKLYICKEGIYLKKKQVIELKNIYTGHFKAFDDKK